MKKINTLNLLVNFIPIIILYLLVTYTPEFVKFSHTILGKAFAVVLILFYTMQDFVLGLFVCALVIFYYQTDYVESFNNMLNEGFTENIESEEDKESEEKKEKQESEEKQEKQESQEKEEKEEKKQDEVEENFETLEDAYPLEPTKQITYNCSVDNFKKLHCKNGHLIHKGQSIKPEMAEHVYPVIQQNEFKKCNICDPTCEFEINDRRLAAEADLTTPKSSNDLFQRVWENLRTTTEQIVNR